MSNLARFARPQRVAVPVEQPAPILGWNARDGYADMDPRFAVQLDNWFPESSSVVLRDGYSEHCEIAAVAKTIFCYAYEGTSKLLAFTDDAIIDVSSATPSDLDTGVTEGFWSCIQHGGFGIFVNGTDTPRKYDGTTLSTTTFTGSGLTATDLYGVLSHKHRLFFWEENSTTFWYTDDVDVITGTVIAFDLKYVHNTRGHIVNMGTWTFDGGSGVDDVLAIFMADGQVFAYSGSDPGDAEDWALIGVFDIGGHPMGHRGVAQYGGDLIILTENGYFPLSKALTLGSVSNAITVSDAINGAVVDLARLYSGNEFWQVLLRGGESQLIVNVPSSSVSGTWDQHVMNTRTGAWCRFTGMDASCFVEHGGELYFASASEAKIFIVGADADDGSDIVAIGQQAFTTLGIPQQKSWKMVRPILQVIDGLDVTIGMAIDYADAPSFASISSVPISGVAWDSDDAVWDEAEWAGSTIVQRAWQGAEGFGYAGSLVMKVQTQAQDVRWFSTTHLVEPGGPV